jgi:hypothetical protein
MLRKTLLKSTLFVVAMALPMLAVNAGQLADRSDSVEVTGTPTAGTCCWVYVMGRYWCIPC